MTTHPAGPWWLRWLQQRASRKTSRHRLQETAMNTPADDLAPGPRYEAALKAKADADAFEAQYAHDSGVSVAFLHAAGRQAAPCHCEDELCTGWQMLHLEPDTEAGHQHATSHLTGGDCAR